MRHMLGSESASLLAEVEMWLPLRITKVDKGKLLTLLGTRRRLSVSTESKKVLLWWYWSSTENPSGGFRLTWDVKPILTLKSQT
jgi:hypothetical protein